MATLRRRPRVWRSLSRSSSPFLASRRHRRNTSALGAVDEDDLAQALRLALWEKCERFNPDRTSFRTFADRVAASTVGSLVRRETAQCRDHRRSGPSLNGASWTVEPETQPRTDDASSAFEQQLWHEDLVQILPPPHRSVAELLAHHSELRVSQLLGVSRHSVRDSITRIRRLYEARRLREELGDCSGIPDK